MDMRLYLIGTLVGLFAIALLNYWVDADRIWYRASTPFKRSLEPGEVRIVRSTAGSNREERISQLAVSPIADLILMGSSPTVRTSQNFFSSQTRFFNLGVSGGHIDEYAAFWLAAKDLNRIPKYLVISLEPSSFNDSMGKGFQEWLKESGYFEKIHQAIRFPLPEQNKQSKYLARALLLKNKLVPLFKWESLQRSLQYLIQWGIHIPPDFEVVKEADLPEDLYAFRSDGSMIFPKKIFTSMNLEKIDQAAALMPDKKTDYLFVNYSRSEKGITLLKYILNDAAALNVRVMLMVHPFHPSTYDRMIKTPEYSSIIADSKAILEQISKEHPEVSICDVFNPSITGCTHSEFLDAYHYQPACDQKMFNYCFSRAPGWNNLVQNMVLNGKKN